MTQAPRTWIELVPFTQPPALEFESDLHGNTEKMWDNSGRKKPHKTLKIRAGKMAVTVGILPR
jgi:hypothetical protein